MNKVTTLLIMAVSVFIVSCGQQQNGQQQRTQATAVNTQKVQKSHTVYYDKYPGTAMALQKVDLHSEVSGYIRKISFEEGEKVSAGKPLYTIDQSKYLAARNQAAAHVKVAKANMKQAQLDADRYIALGKKDAIAKQQVDLAKTRLENAKQQVAAAKADLERAQTDLNYSTIEAPFGGIIGISNVRLGAYVVAGQTLLNTISSYNPMGIDFDISETEISRYVGLKGNPAVIRDSMIYLTLPDGTRYDHYGKIAIIDRGINAQTGTIKVRLSFENPDKKLRDGMSVTVHVRNANSGQNLIIPHKAVLEQMGEYFVFVVNEGKAQQQKIEPGRQIGDKVVVNSGLKEGQEIVVEGIQRLRNGMPVQTGHPQTKANAAAKSAE